jgi:SAM-dependent methyltransferase
MQPTERFSDRVDNYIKYRPTYPSALLDFFSDQLGVKSGSPVADLGAGTGMLTSLLLDRGYKVFAVEPNANMRAAAEAALGNNEGFTSIDGTGEATTLPDNAVQLITIAQAFHWMDPAATKKECARILQPGGYVSILWNLRLLDSPFAQAYEAVKVKFGIDYNTIRKADEAELTAFFAPAKMDFRSFYHTQYLDLQGLIGQLQSSSYIPQENQHMIQELEKIFAEHEENGRVGIPYQTKVYSGTL